MRRAASNRALILVAVAAATVQTAAHLVNALVLDYRYPGLDAAGDRNAFGWATVVLAWSAAAALVATSVRCRPAAAARRLVLAATLFFLGGDDLLGIHDRLPGATSGARPSFAGMVADAAYVGVVCGAFLLLWVEARTRRLTGSMRAGLGILGLAVSLRGVGAVIAVGGSTADDDLRALATAGVQALDLAGWILVAGALLLAGRPALGRVDRQLRARVAVREQHGTDPA